MNTTRNMMVLALTGALSLAACGGDDGNNANSANSVNNTNNASDGGNNVNNVNNMTDAGNNANNTNNVNNEVDMSIVTGEIRRPTVFSALPPIPSSCDNPDAKQRVPFIFNTDDVVPLVTGDIVNGLMIQPNITLDTGALVAERTRLHVNEQVTCTSDADCAGDFKCAASGLPGAQRQCTVTTGIEFIPRSVTTDFDPGLTDKKQLVAVLMENTAGLVGRLPTDSGGLYDADGEKDLFQDVARATDLQRVYRDSVQDFFLNLASVTDPLNTKVGLWWYAGQVPAEVRPLIDPQALEDHFTNDLSVGQDLESLMLPEPVPKPSNLYQAMLKVIDRDMGLDKYDDHEKFMFVFTDGPNEVYDADATYAKVLETMEAENIHVFIVHLDSAIDPTLIRDLPTLWAGNRDCQEDSTCVGAPACGSDSDCPNYAECRSATVYAELENDPVTQTPQNYCMPSYDSTGRIGPIDELADLACRTGGNYMYVPDAESMRPYFRVVPSSFDGQFSIEADISALSNPDVSSGFYRLSAVLVGSIGEGDLDATWSSPVGFTVADTRPVIRRGRVTNP